MDAGYVQFWRRISLGPFCSGGSNPLATASLPLVASSQLSVVSGPDIRESATSQHTEIKHDEPLATLRNPKQKNTISVQLVPGMRSLVFDFGGGAMPGDEVLTCHVITRCQRTYASIYQSAGR
eukprot:2705241-Rhodomonas_salina.1